METVPSSQLSSAGDIAEAAAEARRAGRLGIDTEFMSEGRYRALLCLVQVAVDNPTAGGDPLIFLIDALADLDVQPLAALLGDPEIEVVLHAGRQDVAILRRAWRTELNNIFDTQIAAGFTGASAQAGLRQPARVGARPAGGQDRQLHPLGRAAAHRRAARLRRRGRRPPAPARRRDPAAAEQQRPRRVGARGVPPPGGGHRRARPRDRVGAPAPDRPARSPLARRGPDAGGVARAHGIGPGPPGRLDRRRPGAGRAGQAPAVDHRRAWSRSGDCTRPRSSAAARRSSTPSSAGARRRRSRATRPGPAPSPATPR